MALNSSQISALLYKHYLGTGSTRTEREFFEEAVKSSFIVQPKDLWAYGDRIPDGTEDTGGKTSINEIINLGKNGNDDTFYHYINEGESKVPLVKRYIDLQLSMIDKGTDNAFLILDKDGNQIKNIIPFNYYEEYYNYELKTSSGKLIPFGVGDWSVDIHSGIVTFYGTLPDEVNHENPPKLSFYQYVGGNGFRQDTYGYDGAILPLDAVDIKSNSCSFTNGSEGRTLYEHIKNKANEIHENFVDVFGFDGSNKNEGIALSFEKIIPLTYTSNLDPVKGYDKATESEIGTLLSNKTIKYENTPTNYEIVFASQKCNISNTYKISINDSVAIAYNNDEEQSSTKIVGNDWNLYKIWVSDKAFVVLKVVNNINEEITFTVEDLTTQQEKTITCLLLYWDDETRQYQPFLPKEDILGNFGFPVVTINGRLPPSVQLGTAALATFSDSITPDYYGPRIYSVVIAKENGIDVKSADFIVKNIDDWYLNDILEQISIKYDNLYGTLFLRAGTYECNKNLDLSKFKNIILSGENDQTIIDLCGNNIIINNESIFEICHIKFTNVGNINIENNNVLFLSDIIIPKETDLNLSLSKNSNTFIKETSCGNVFITGENSDVINVEVSGCNITNLSISKNQVYVKNNIINNLLIDNDGILIVKNNVINTLSNKFKDTLLDGNTIYAYSNISASASNQIPVGTSADFNIQNYNKDTLTTTGRFPIFSKKDSLHLKYAEFASPFKYNESYNIIELLYDTSVLKIENGKLTTVITSDNIHMSDVTFERHENSGLPPVSYNNTHDLNDVFRHIYKWKADLDEDGKIPLQELPDSVAYGGLLFVGTWSFEKNNGLYPTFEDAVYRENVSDDNKVNELQKGWFFIVSESDDTTDSDDDNDNPVANQYAKDGVVFTAGDWIIYSGDGSDDETNENKSWIKIDRAYSDPTYSPLPYYAKVPEIENLDWYWKRNRQGGALDLSNNTIIQAFKKVNDQLRKLEPKKPASIRDVELIFDEEYPIMEVRKYNNGVLSDVKYKYDSSKINSVSFHTKTFNDNFRTYKELIFFGDSAKVVVTVDNVDHEFTITQDSPEQSDGIVYISAPQETMTHSDHGEGFWKGFYVTINNYNLSDGEHLVRISVDDIKVLYDDGVVDTYQFDSYNGTSNTVVYELYNPYFPQKISLSKDTYFAIAQQTISDQAIADSCSGIRKINLANFKNIPSVSFTLEKIYKDNYVPVGTLAEIEVLLNDSVEFCGKMDISNYIKLEKNIYYDDKYKDLKVDNIYIPVTYSNKNVVIDESSTLDFYITIYDLNKSPHREKIYTYKGVRFDPTTESERCFSGNFNEDSTFKDFTESFGKAWNSNITLTKALFKIGEEVDNETIGVYQQPTGVYNDTDYSLTWTGALINEDYYGTACFNIGHIDDATGFVFRINGLPNDLEKYNFDKLTGSTNNLLLQVCLINPQVDNQNAKVTSFLDANSPYNGFSIVNEKEFMFPVMYAGNSTAIEKRVTFGRNKILSGDVYVRIAIKKDSGLRFTSIDLIEAI